MRLDYVHSPDPLHSVWTTSPPPNRCLVSLILTSSSPTPPIRATHVRMALPVTTSSKKKDFSAGSHSLIALRRAL